MKKTGFSIQTHVWIIILLMINILIGAAGLLKEDGAITLEKLRAGGADNFASIMSFYKSDEYKKQQSDNIPTLLKQMKDGAQEAPTAAAPTATSNSTIKDAVANIQKTAYIQGNKNARYTLLEYSDLECPFCKKHFQNGTVEALLAKYPDKINHIFRQFPLTSIHPSAELAAEASECIAEAKGESAFYSFIGKIFVLPNLSRDAIIATAESVGANKTSFTKCIDSGKFANKVSEELSEGQSLFDIKGTPGNVIVDNETGRFVAIPGAYPIEKFVLELDNLIAAE